MPSHRSRSWIDTGVGLVATVYLEDHRASLDALHMLLGKLRKLGRFWLFLLLVLLLCSLRTTQLGAGKLTCCHISSSFPHEIFAPCLFMLILFARPAALEIGHMHITSVSWSAPLSPCSSRQPYPHHGICDKKMIRKTHLQSPY